MSATEGTEIESGEMIEPTVEWPHVRSSETFEPLKGETAPTRAPLSDALIIELTTID